MPRQKPAPSENRLGDQGAQTPAHRLDRRVTKAMTRGLFALYAARARARGASAVSPRDYYCGCRVSRRTWLPACFIARPCLRRKTLSRGP